MLFVDYTNQVLQDYQKKLAAGKLPLNLSQPTPARLRDECLIVFEDRFPKKDEKTLRDFFGPPGEKGYKLVIKNWRIGKLKAVINFLNDPAIRTDEKKIELLAWLIDFEPRPFDQWKKLARQPVEERTEKPEEEPYVKSPINSPDVTNSTQSDKLPRWGDDEKRIESGEDNSGKLTGTKTDEITGDDGKVGAKPPKPPRNKKNWIIVTVLTMASVISGFLFYKNGQPKLGNDIELGVVSGVPPQDCMIWSVDHYEAIPCDYRYDDGDAVALDSVVLRRFRMITNPETIGIDDKQKVWYDKEDNKIEFFTDSGIHPVNKKQLKPLTDRIYTYHILPLRDSLTR